MNKIPFIFSFLFFFCITSYLVLLIEDKSIKVADYFSSNTVEFKTHLCPHPPRIEYFDGKVIGSQEGLLNFKGHNPNAKKNILVVGSSTSRAERWPMELFKRLKKGKMLDEFNIHVAAFSGDSMPTNEKQLVYILENFSIKFDYVLLRLGSHYFGFFRRGVKLFENDKISSEGHKFRHKTPPQNILEFYSRFFHKKIIEYKTSKFNQKKIKTINKIKKSEKKPDLIKILPPMMAEEFSKNSKPQIEEQVNRFIKICNKYDVMPIFVGESVRPYVKKKNILDHWYSTYHKDNKIYNWQVIYPIIQNMTYDVIADLVKKKNYPYIDLTNESRKYAPDAFIDAIHFSTATERKSSKFIYDELLKIVKDV